MKNMKLEAPLPPEIGDTAKVYLPGESPWVKVCKIWDELTIQGRFESKLAGEYGEASLHGFNKGDDATFFLRPRIFGKDLKWFWELSPPNQQQSLKPILTGEEPKQ